MPSKNGGAAATRGGRGKAVTTRGGRSKAATTRGGKSKAATMDDEIEDHPIPPESSSSKDALSENVVTRRSSKRKAEVIEVMNEEGTLIEESNSNGCAEGNQSGSELTDLDDTEKPEMAAAQI